MRILNLFFVAGLSIGCGSGGNKVPADTGDVVVDTDADGDDTGSGPVDADSDGFTSDEDCDDADATVFPGADEVAYDGIDQDCDDVDLTDVDGDGQAWVGVLDGTDCDDSDASIYDGADEVAYDGIDQDCDEADLTDVDGDGQDSDIVEGGTDCNDDDSTIYDGADEVAYDGIDQDCDGADFADVDGDGVDSDVVGGLDCDDDDPEIHPGVEDIPYDGIDQDCSGSDLTDVDGDGHDGTAVDGGDDCNDLDATISPSADETPYDGIDDDCDGSDLTDVDGDGYDALVVDGTDCDDDDAASYPGATETPYDGVDQDCDGSDWADVDGDGEDWDGVTGGTDCDDADPDISTAATETPYDGVDDDCSGADLTDVDGDGHDSEVVDGDDCDDYDDDVYPEAPELDDSEDNDCDVLIDEDFITGRDILINEVMADPDVVGDSEGEWIELYNNSDRSINLIGWTLRRSGSDFADVTIDEDLSVDPGDYLILGVNADWWTNGHIFVDYEYSWGDFTLVNDGFAFKLERGGDLIHSIGFPYMGPVVGIAATPGVAYGFEYRHTSLISSDQWCDQQSEQGTGDLGTPGGLNDVCEDMTCVDGGRVMGDFSDDTTGATDTDPYTSCTPWYTPSPDLTFAYTPEETGCYKFSAEGTDGDWYPSIGVGTSCGSFELAGTDRECDDAWFMYGLFGSPGTYHDAVVYKHISAGNTQYVLINGVASGSGTTISASGPGEFGGGIELVDSSHCD